MGTRFETTAEPGGDAALGQARAQRVAGELGGLEVGEDAACVPCAGTPCAIH